MQGRTYADLPLQALLMAVWRRKPKTKVHVHSDQGSQFTGYEWQEFLEQHNLVPSMSRRANCWDRAIGRNWFKPNGEGGRRELLQPAQTRTYQA